MASMIGAAVKYYDDILENADPRVEDWAMMQSVLPSFILTVLYLLIVKMGPSLMGDRKPMEIRKVLLVYNFGMVVLSTYIFVEFLLSGWLTGYSLGCQTVDYSRSPKAMRMANVCWMFYISKFIEYFDTFFFILRKKFNQVSFLHVFHHAIMPISWWFGVKFVPGGFGTFHALLNSFIHMMMYCYYGLSALGPAYQKYLWWKKYMTTMQLTQFVLVTVHCVQLLFIECDYPTLFVYWVGLYAVVFLFMFADFYTKSYKPSAAAKNTDSHIVQNGVKPKEN